MTKPSGFEPQRPEIGTPSTNSCGPSAERVVRTAYQVTGNLEDALDVAQGVFLKLWQGLDRYDPARTFDTWVYRITVNAAIDSLRSKGPRGMMHPLPDEAEETLPAPVSRSAEEKLDLTLLQAAFQRLATGLAPKQRAAFVLREIEGRSTAEVARILDVTESTIRNHLLQARRILRQGLERDYPELIQAARKTETEGDR